MNSKRYRIEDSLGLSAAALRNSNENGAGPKAQFDQIMGAITDLRRLTEASSSETVEACRRELSEAYAMRGELDLMKDAITRTKNEIATLHRSDNAGKGMRRVAGELDAVIESTEVAATTIINAIEDIETQANQLRVAKLPAAAQARVDRILERTITAYEACNFQDLTGQRISKIVGVLKFIEEHLDTMIETWSHLDSFRVLIEEQADGDDRDDESALLNGPRLAEDDGHVDQTDIDALFD